MKFDHLDQIIFEPETSIKKVLERFGETAIHTQGHGFGIIIDNKKKCIGVVTDGDIRKSLVSGEDLESPVSSAMNPNFKRAEVGFSSHKLLRLFDDGVFNLPLLDDKEKVIDLYQYSNFIASSHSNSRIIRARAPVRVSFSGGGTDMSHYIKDRTATVLSSTISKYCTASVMVRPDAEIHILSKDLNISSSSKSLEEIKYGDELDLIKAAIKLMKPDFGFNLETFAEFEPGTGLGGSSAVTMAVLGALNNFRNEKQLDNYQLADLAYQVERVELGKEGGWQDQYATSFGGFNWIEFRKDDILVNPLRINRQTILELEYNLMLFRVGATRKSDEIQQTHNSESINSKKRNALYSNMLALSEKMKESLLKSELKRLGDILHESWVIKKKFGSKITNPQIDNYYNKARDLGALGGKLLGAGQAGYLLLYVSPMFQKTIQKELESLGAKLEPFRFTNSGLEVWSTIR